MQKAFVRFKAPNWTEENPVFLPDIFSVFDSGLIRATLLAEWNNREVDQVGDTVLPVWTEEASQLDRWKQYDMSLRDPDVDTDD